MSPREFFYQVPPADSVLIGSDEIYVLPQESTLAEVIWVAAVDACTIKVRIVGVDGEINHANNGGQAFFYYGAIVAGVEEAAPPAPTLAKLYPNAPNPFNPSTTIRFDLPDKRLVSLRIYDVQGRLVRLLLDRALPAGNYALRWDGTNDRHVPVSSGIYFCRMAAGDYRETLKLVLLR